MITSTHWPIYIYIYIARESPRSMCIYFYNVYINILLFFHFRFVKWYTWTWLINPKTIQLDQLGSCSIDICWDLTLGGRSSLFDKFECLPIDFFFKKKQNKNSLEIVHPDFLSFEVFCFEVEPHYFCSCIFHDSFCESWEGNSFHRLAVGIQT